MTTSAAPAPSDEDGALPPVTRAFCLDCATAQSDLTATACALCGSDFLMFSHRQPEAARRPLPRAKRRRRAA